MLIGGRGLNHRSKKVHHQDCGGKNVKDIFCCGKLGWMDDYFCVLGDFFNNCLAKKHNFREIQRGEKDGLILPSFSSHFCCC